MTNFDDFARRWLLLRRNELTDYMITAILTGPLRRVPPKFRKIAVALRMLRARARVRVRSQPTTGKRRVTKKRRRT